GGAGTAGSGPSAGNRTNSTTDDDAHLADRGEPAVFGKAPDGHPSAARRSRVQRTHLVGASHARHCEPSDRTSSTAAGRLPPGWLPTHAPDLRPEDGVDPAGP